MSANKEILMKFITAQNEKIRKDVSMQGYKDTSPYKNNPSNTIYGSPQGTPITMKGVSTPLIGIDEFGNMQEMIPEEEYFFPGSRVKETRMQNGGQNLYNVSMNNPMIIPSQGMNPVGYYDTLPKNEAGIPYDKDGTLFTQSKMVSRFDENGKPLSAFQVRENQKMWNMQKMAYSPEQQTFNLWKNNPQNTEQGFYNTREYGKYLKNIIPTGKDVGLDGLCDPNFSSTKCGTSKQHAKEDKKEWSKKQEGGEQDFTNVQEWFNKYIDSPLYRRNIENSGYENVDDVIAQRKANVNRTGYELDENRLGTYYKNTSNKIHNAPKTDSKNWSKQYPSVLPNDSVLAHEFGHAVLDSNQSWFGNLKPFWNKNDYDQLESRNKNKRVSRGAMENYADQKELQYTAAKLGIYNPGFEEFTEEHLDKLPTDLKDRALQNYSKEDLIWLMNNIAQNNDNSNDQLAIAQNGGDLYQYQNGSQTWDKQKQNLKNEKLEKLKRLLSLPDPVFKAKTFEEKVAEKMEQEKYKTTSKDNTTVRSYNNANKHSNAARNKTNKEFADERQAKIDAQVQANKQPFDWNNFRQSLSDRSQATGDAMRISNEPNFFDDYINPAVMIGSMADNLGQAPLRAQQEDSYMPYVTSVGAPLMLGAAAGLGTSNNAQFINNIVNPVAGADDLLKGILAPKNILVDEQYMGNNLMLNALNDVKSTTLPSKTKLNELRDALEHGEQWKYPDINFAEEIARLKKSAKTEADIAYIDALEKQYDKNVSWHDAVRNRANPVFLTGQSLEDMVNPLFKNPEGDQWFAMQQFRHAEPKGKHFGYIADEADYIHASKYRLPGNRFDTEGMMKDIGDDASTYFNERYKPLLPDFKNLPLNQKGGLVNFLQKAQEGRTVTVDQGDGIKKKILTDSKEYSDLYDEGRIGVKNDDGSISFNPFNEVVITPYDKQYPFYQELSDEEKKYFNSDSPIGRQIRSKAQDNVGFNADKAKDFAMGWLKDIPLAALQSPQSALVEGVEALRGNDFNMLNALEPDKQRIPSETWRVENPYAAFAVDALTDPETLIGMSLLKNSLQKGVKKLGNIKTSIDPELKQGLQTNGFFDMFKSKKPITTSVKNLDQTIVSKPWEMQELPGLHLKSTMEGEAISKIVEPKTGLINTEQALAIIGKESGGADKVAIIKQGLGENIPKKMDYNDFRKVVQNQLIPLETNLAEHSSNYGLSNIGYPSPKRSSYDSAITFATQDIKNITNKIKDFESKGFVGNPDSEVPMFLQRADYESNLSELYQRLGESKAQLAKNQESLKNLPLENKTIIFGNKEKFGKGSNAHHNSDETLGHAHYLIDAETPDVFTITQLQSDAFQGSHRIMPKTFDPEKAKYTLGRMAEIQEKNKSVLNKMITEGVDETGRPVVDYEIKQLQEIVDAQELQNALQKGHVENFSQKSLLDKNHQERYLQELVNHAAQRGDINKVRVPTSETAANVQSYATIRKYTDEQQTLFNKISKEKEAIIDNSLDSEGFIDYKKAELNPRYIELTKEQEKLQAGVKMDYDNTSKTILKKYSEQPKLIKKLFGQDAKIVTDSKGNTWYEFDIPKNFKEGKGQIKAFLKGGETDFEKYAMKEMGGMLYANKNAKLPHEQSMKKYLSAQKNLLEFMHRIKANGGMVPFDEYYKQNIIFPRNKS